MKATVLATATAMAMASLTTGCRDQSPPKEPEGKEAITASPTTSEGRVVVLTWEEYFSPEVVSAFEAETGLKVEFVYFENLDEMQGLIQSQPGTFDVVVADGRTVADLIDLQLLQPLQKDGVPNFVNLDSKYLKLKFDPKNDYSVPYMWGTTLMAYRSDLIPEPADTWNALWDERYAGKILMLDDSFDSYAVALLSLGYDINSEDPGELAEATKRLVDQADRLGAKFDGIISLRERLLSGDCWICMTYSSDAAVLAEENENIAYFIPKEGAALWVDSFAIPREASDVKNGHRFIDFICRGEIAAMNSNFLWCASANREAKKFLSQEVRDDETLYLDDETLAKCNFDSQSGIERNRIVNHGMKLVYDHVQKLQGGKVESASVTEIESPNFDDNN